jgi:hypothetical protein
MKAFIARPTPPTATAAAVPKVKCSTDTAALSKLIEMDGFTVGAVALSNTMPTPPTTLPTTPEKDTLETLTPVLSVPATLICDPELIERPAVPTPATIRPTSMPTKFAARNIELRAVTIDAVCVWAAMPARPTSVWRAVLACVQSKPPIDVTVAFVNTTVTVFAVVPAATPTTPTVTEGSVALYVEGPSHDTVESVTSTVDDVMVPDEAIPTPMIAAALARSVVTEQSDMATVDFRMEIVLDITAVAVRRIGPRTSALLKTNLASVTPRASTEIDMAFRPRNNTPPLPMMQPAAAVNRIPTMDTIVGTKLIPVTAPLHTIGTADAFVALRVMLYAGGGDDITSPGRGNVRASSSVRTNVAASAPPMSRDANARR